MPRAHRHFIPGHIWHITHRCHEKQFLLRFDKDRSCWRSWLFEAKRRFGLRVLNYVVTSNHVHLLVRDQGRGEIARSMQLVAGRTAQGYNQRKNRRGAFWEDRYHATAIDSEEYLARCVVYIDLNMVRAGVVQDPIQWPAGGYREIQNPHPRYRILDLPALAESLGLGSVRELQLAHARWVEEGLGARSRPREPMWSESLAVGSEGFIQRVRLQMGAGATYRRCVEGKNAHQLQEPAPRWLKRVILASKRTL